MTLTCLLKLYLDRWLDGFSISPEELCQLEPFKSMNTTDCPRSVKLFCTNNKCSAERIDNMLGKVKPVLLPRDLHIPTVFAAFPCRPD